MRSFYIFLAALLVAGCAKKAADSQATAPAVPAMTAPASVITEGYHWYGLDSTKPIPIKETGAGQALTGSMSFALSKVSADSADFTQEWSGDLADQFPTYVVQARPDGIYVVSYGGKPLAKPVLDLPADPTPGKTWTYSMQISQDGQQQDVSGTQKVIGPTKLTLNGKQYDALDIKDDMVVRTGKQSTPTKGEKWLVKGLGTVKMELDLSSPAGTKRVVVEASQ